MAEPENKPLKDFGGGECSETFKRAFCSSSSLAISCTACGRLHYTDGYLNN